MGWQIGVERPRSRHFSLTPGADPAQLLPKRPRSGGERQAGDTDEARSVPPPGSPEDPCRDVHLALARIMEAAQLFPDAHEAIRQALIEHRKRTS